MNSPIIRIAARGEGVTADGRFVPLTAPGDIVADDGTITHGSNHQGPQCPHYPTCGGCQLQHLADDAYAAYCRDRVLGALAGQGIPVTDDIVRPAIVSAPQTRRRASLKALRTGRHVTLGFARQGSHDLVDVRDCAVLVPALLAMLDPLRALLATLLRPKQGAEVKLTLADQGVDALIIGARPDDLAAHEAIAEFCAAHNLARLAFDRGDGPETHWEPAPVTITLAGVPVALPHGAFLQATADGEAALRAAVLTAINGAAITADLFAGLGTFALGVAGKVYAAEAARDAVLALQAASGRAGRMVACDHRDLFRRPLTPAECSRFAAIILDPPRAGAEAQVAEIANSSAPRIAYVSCNPASFARDAKTLIAGGYRLDWVQPVGQFRWSTHVELVGAFAR